MSTTAWNICPVHLGCIQQAIFFRRGRNREIRTKKPSQSQLAVPCYCLCLQWCWTNPWMSLSFGPLSTHIPGSNLALMGFITPYGLYQQATQTWQIDVYDLSWKKCFPSIFAYFGNSKLVTNYVVSLLLELFQV